MKRIVCIGCLLALLLSACSLREQTPAIPEDNYTQGVYELTFTTEKISNNRVGNDWSFTYTHNGQTVKSGYQITQDLEIFTFQSIGVEIQENDKFDDGGTGVLRVAMCDGGSGKTTVTVTENGGPYEGSEAVWEITCSVTLISKQ